MCTYTHVQKLTHAHTLTCARAHTNTQTQTHKQWWRALCVPWAEWPSPAWWLTGMCLC